MLTKSQIERAYAIRDIVDKRIAEKSSEPDEIIDMFDAVRTYKQAEVHAIGDVRRLDDQVKQCKIAYDGSVQAGWDFDEPTIWYPYHGTTPETALPWHMPGGHAPYKLGECMVWTDGNVYRCIAANGMTVYSPIEHAQSWELVSL